MKHVGILAHSADGSALYFLEMVREPRGRLDHTTLLDTVEFQSPSA